MTDGADETHSTVLRDVMAVDRYPGVAERYRGAENLLLTFVDLEEKDGANLPYTQKTKGVLISF